jgi:predicted ATPase/DNA-binding SARP family transcriptional activator/Tfp pilus assembly protein PilF
MAGMRINCFGHLRIETDGQSIDRFETDKARALLVYLAIENGHPQRRSHLAGLLWSDQSEEQALHSLRQTLSSLRKTLGDHSSTNPFIIAERDRVQINPANSVWVDVLAFRSGLAAAYRHYQRRQQCLGLNVRRLSATMALRQAPFLDHFELKGSPLFNEWLALLREELDQRSVEGLSLLAQVYERRGEYALVHEVAQQIIKINPWDETAHTQLMRLYVQAGQWGAAQNQYQALRRFLNEQLGVEPSRETNRLFEQIRAAGPNPPAALLQFEADPSNLPVSATPFIGREKELDEITDLITDPAARLLTLLGPGGIGKTRLALEAARQQVGLFNDGVFFVPLVVVSSVDQVHASIADALGLVLAEQSQPQARLIDYLREKQLLLVLDNYEQLLGDIQATQPVLEILKQAAGVTLLVTSRERLMLQEEWIYPVPGLGYPSGLPTEILSTTELVARYDALDLFYRRACQARHGFTLDSTTLPSVVSICQMLDGLPLGVELAAAAIWDQPCSIIAEKITSDLNTIGALASNVQPRHRSLWAAFDVSWQLLTTVEQALFCRLAVFRGGFTLQAAQQVAQATPDLLAALVNQSLVRSDTHGRYELHEAVRQYAFEKLAAAGCMEDSRAAHAHFYSAFLAEQRQALVGHAQKQSLADIQVELSNISPAWDWLLQNLRIAEILSCIDPLYQFFNIRSRFNEGIAMLHPVIALLEENTNPETGQALETALGMVLARIGSLAYYSRQNTLAIETLERSREIFTRLNHPTELAFCQNTLGGVYLRSKNFARAQACAQQNLDYYRQVGDPLGENRALYLLGLIQNRLGKLRESKEYFLAAVAAGRRVEDRRRLTAPLNMLGDIACTEGDYAEAEILFKESLTIARDLEDLFYQAIVLNNLANVYHYNHQFPLAREAYEDSLSICLEIGDRDGEAMALNNLGELAVVQGEFSQAIVFSEQALQIARQVGEEWTIVVCLNNLGEANCGLGKYEVALKYLVEAIRTAWEIGAVDCVARFAVNAGRCFQLQGRRPEAQALYLAALAHSATEHDACEKATGWLKEMNVDALVNDDDHALEGAITHLILC